MNLCNKNKVIILGSGTSTGVPMPGCHCAVCKSPDEKNKRFRTSIFLKTQAGNSILVDTTPDLRSQALQNQIDKIDAAIITHDHADHVHGIDDLRPFCYLPTPRTLPVFTSSFSAESLKARFPYIFQVEKVFSNKPILGGGIPRLSLQIVGPSQAFSILGETFRFFLCPHGHTQTLGFIHHKLAYFTDCHRLSDSLVEELQKSQLDLLIIDCIRKKSHSTHLHLDASISYTQRIQAKSTGLIHMAHDFDHQELIEELRTRKMGENVFPLFDRQVLEYS